MTRTSVLINHSVDIDILGHERRNSLLMKFIVLSMPLIDHANRYKSEKCRYTDHGTNNAIQHNIIHVILSSHIKIM